MKTGSILIPLLAMTLSIGSATSTQPPDAPLFAHSAIALMPEGEPEEVGHFEPLNPTVMAWGIDPVFQMNDLERLKVRFEAYRELGVAQRAVNVWMLTATSMVLHNSPEFRDAVCLDVAGNRIVPSWLADGDYQGTPAYWGCTNHPLFRQQVIDRARAGILAGGNLLHLDDHMGTAAAAVHAGGCFCDHCVEGFRTWLMSTFGPDELCDIGVINPGRFDYRATVRDAGFNTLDRYQAGVRADAVPMRELFLAFQRQAAAAFIAKLSEVANEAAGGPIPIGVNAWNLAPTQLATSHQADYFANEIQHYDREDLVPPSAYLLAAALGKPVFATGTGEDWIEVGKHDDVVRVRRWIATAAVFGQYFMYAHRKWGFSPETGTRWYTTPIETYLPLTDFISGQPELFDGTLPMAQVGVLYDNATCRRDDWTVREITRSLHDAGLTCGYVVAGDDWLQHNLTESELDVFEMIVIPPGIISPGQPSSIMEDRLASGQAVVWDGVASLTASISPWIHREGPGRLWIAPRRKGDGSSPSLVVHLLNQDYDPETDSMVPNDGSILSIDLRLTDGRPPERITLYAPGCEPRVLDVTSSEVSSTIRLPEIELWSVLQVQIDPRSSGPIRPN